MSLLLLSISLVLIPCFVYAVKKYTEHDAIETLNSLKEVGVYFDCKKGTFVKK